MLGNNRAVNKTSRRQRIASIRMLAHSNGIPGTTQRELVEAWNHALGDQPPAVGPLFVRVEPAGWPSLGSLNWSSADGGSRCHPLPPSVFVRRARSALSNAAGVIMPRPRWGAVVVLVVVPADHDLGFEHGVEQLPVEELVAHDPLNRST